VGSRIKSQLRFGLWPESKAPASHHVGLTLAAKRLAQSTLAELTRLGVSVTIDDEGRARFRTTKLLSPAAKRLIETHADLLESWLREK
jgi:hypothetical protein